MLDINSCHLNKSLQLLFMHVFFLNAIALLSQLEDTAAVVNADQNINEKHAAPHSPHPPPSPGKKKEKKCSSSMFQLSGLD